MRDVKKRWPGKCICMKYKNTKWKAISSKGIWIKLQFNSAREKEREKNFIRSTNKSRSVLRKKYTNQGVIFVLRMSSFPKRKNERQSKKKKVVGKVFLSTQVPWKNPPDPNFMKPIKKLGNLSWQMPVGLVFEAYAYWG